MGIQKKASPTDGAGQLDIRRQALAVLLETELPSNTREFLQKVGDIYTKTYPKLYSSNSEEASVAILRQILTSTTAEEILAESAVKSIEDYVGKTIQVNSVKLQPSDYTEGSPWYVVMEGVDLETRMPEVFTSGSGPVVVAVLALYETAQLPEVVRVTSAKTHGGYDVYRLVKAPSPHGHSAPPF